MDKQYSYEDLFQRNIGVFTKEEQEQIRNLKVANVPGAIRREVAALKNFFLKKFRVKENRPQSRYFFMV